jgi:hypothetical protein
MALDAGFSRGPLLGHSGRWRFHFKVIGVSDLGVRFREISDGAIDPLRSPAISTRDAIHTYGVILQIDWIKAIY